MAHTTLGSVFRSNQAYALQISQAESLEWGIAYTSPAFPALPDANQVREVTVADERKLPDAYAEVEAYFASRGLQCHRWVPAADQPYETLGQFLWERGYRRRDLAACVLAHWPQLAVPAGLRILPGRPMRAPLRSTFVDPDSGLPADYQQQWADCGLERLDEASYEAYVAIRGEEAVGRCALFQVGDIGRVIDLYVPVRYRRQGVATALVGHVLAVAKRLLMRTICSEVYADHEGAVRCVEKAGFVRDGKMVEFLHPDAPRV